MSLLTRIENDVPFPQPPEKIVQFRKGTAAPYDIERQFDEHARSFRNLVAFLKEVIRDDGAIRNGRIGAEQLDPDLVKVLAKSAMLELDTLLESIRNESRQASADVSEMRSLLDKIREREHQISLVAANMQQALHETRERLNELSQLASSPMSAAAGPTGVLGPPYSTTAAGMPAFYGVDTFDNLASLATSTDYAQVSMEWAEHMPDTIPPNILAINGVTGDHWSSRWWANRAASIFGGDVVWLYLGVFPTSEAPATTPTGEPLLPGMIYYDSTKNQMMVWNGSYWQSLGSPQPAITSMLYYLATANQTAFPLTANDLLGHSYTLQTGQGVAVYLNGVRLTPDDGSGTKGDYSVNVATSTVNLLTGAPAGAMVGIDALALPSQLAPSVAKIHHLKPLIPAFDGVTTAFTMQSGDGTTVNVTASEQVFYSLDGVSQEPTVAFTASGATITFVTAPTADAYGFGVWASPT